MGWSKNLRRAGWSRHARIGFRVGVMTVAAAAMALTVAGGKALYEGGPTQMRRRLLSAASCDKDDLDEWEKNGGVALYIFLVIYLFLGIAIVCDDFFVAALEHISEALGLSEDVAGATFMAAGSSAPELFSSLVSLINPSTNNELGIGTIVGSAVFNVLVIIGATAVFSGQVLELDWRPIARDAAFYIVSVVTLILFFLDEKVYWWEGLIAVFLYCSYVLFMRFNQRYMDALERWFPAAMKHMASRKDASIELAEAKKATEAGDAAEGASAHKAGAAANGAPGNLGMAAAKWHMITRMKVMSPKNAGEDSTDTARTDAALQKTGDENGTSSHRPDDAFAHAIRAMVSRGRAAQAHLHRVALHNNRAIAQHVKQHEAYMRHSVTSANEAAMGGREGSSGSGKVVPVDGEGNQATPRDVHTHTHPVNPELVNEEDEEEIDNPFEVPDDWKEWPMWVLSLPWYAMFVLTIPDCRKAKWDKWYALTFIMSIAWIGGISWFMVEWAAKIGCILGVPDVVMGVTVLAAGTSVPDALSSIVVARQGMGDMAVANAIGSNVFDIWLGLGAPWFFVLVIRQEPQEIEKKGLWWNVIILLGVVCIYLASVTFDKFRLRPTTGYAFMACYLVYAVYQIVCVWLLDIYGLDDD